MDALVGVTFAAGLAFARIGSMLMLLPGLGEPGIPARIRLSFAFIAALAFGPTLAPVLPPMPDEPIALAVLVGGEVLVGLAFGAAARMLLAAIDLAGQIIGMQSGLAMAQSFDPSRGQQSAIVGVFLNITAIALLFALDLHHVLLAGVQGSYVLSPPGAPIPVGDFSELAVSVSSEAFVVAVRMGAPVLVFGLVFYAGFGVLSKLMPQAQVFFIAMPASILVTLVLLAAALGGIMLVWVNQVEAYGAGML